MALSDGQRLDMILFENDLFYLWDTNSPSAKYTHLDYIGHPLL